MITSNTYKLRQAIALALKQKPRAKEADIAKFILETEMESVMNWANERLLLLVRREIRQKQPLPEAGPYQMFLEGFGSLAERLPLPGRGRVTLGAATIVDLRRSLKLTREKGLADTQRLTALIQGMAPFEETRQGLTVERYCELRAAGVSPRAKSARA